MQLTEMILKVAQNCTLGYCTAFWFPALVALMALMLGESTTINSSRAEDESATGLPIILVAGGVWEGPSWPSYWPHSASSVSVSGDSM